MSHATELRFGRMIPAMVTPFDNNLQVDIKQAVALAERLVEGGSDSLLVFGTTGESPTVTTEDKLAVFQAIVEAIDGEVPVIANVGTNNTQASIDFALRVQELGVAGLMAVVPYYNKPPQEGLYAHFKAFADTVDLPVILYNIPGRCGVNMTADTTLALARDVKNIVAVKEASGNLDQIQTICENAPEGFVVYSGDDALTFDVMKRGGVGVITTTGNVAPTHMKQIVEFAAQGAWDQALAAHEKLLPLMRHLFVTANPILVKEALNICGFTVGGVRLPLVRATEDQSAELARVLREVGVLA